MIVYTLLFTLVGKKTEENLYIQMFDIWLCYLIKNGGLTPEDKISVVIDSETLKYIQSQVLPNYLKYVSPCPIEYVEFEQPKNLSEGIIARYNSLPRDHEGKTLLFLDLDVLVIKSLQNDIPRLLPNQLMIMPEGKMAHGLYAGGLVNYDKIPNICGFAASTFAYSYGEGIEKFFKKVTEECLENKNTPNYTIDQPYYNKWIYLMLTEQVFPVEIHLLRYTMIEQNKMNMFEDSTVLVNYAGTPGEGIFHYQKMLNAICLEYLKK